MSSDDLWWLGTKSKPTAAAADSKSAASATKLSSANTPSESAVHTASATDCGACATEIADAKSNAASTATTEALTAAASALTLTAAGTAATADSGTKSLALLYHDAVTAHTASANSDEPPATKQATIQALFLQFLRVEKMVAAAGIWSANETELSDISTADLKYLMCDYYLGDLLMNMSPPPGSGASAQRLKRVQNGVVYLKRFCTRCHTLKLMSVDDFTLYKRYSSTGSSVVVTPTVAREQKMASGKREREVAAKLTALTQRRDALKKAGKLDDANAEDDESEREWTTAQIENGIQLALRHLSSVAREIEMLEFGIRRESQMASDAKATGRNPAPGSTAAHSHAHAHDTKSSADVKKKPEVYKISNASQLANLPASMAQHLNVRAADGSLHSVSTMNSIQNAINRATNVRETVFRDPNPPTMDMDTFLARERASGAIQPAQTKPELTDEERAALEEEDNDANDKATVKARNWDNWKDEHERGAGNKMK